MPFYFDKYQNIGILYTVHLMFNLVGSHVQGHKEMGSLLSILCSTYNVTEPLKETGMSLT